MINAYPPYAPSRTFNKMLITIFTSLYLLSLFYRFSNSKIGGNSHRYKYYGQDEILYNGNIVGMKYKYYASSDKFVTDNEYIAPNHNYFVVMDCKVGKIIHRGKRIEI